MHLWSSVDRYPRSIPSINARSTLHQHLSWHSINAQSTSQSTVSQELTNFISMRMSWLALCQLSINCWLSVDRASIKMSIKCQLHVHRVLIRMSIEGIDQHSTADVFGTHDLILMQLYNPIRVSHCSPPLYVSGRSWTQKSAVLKFHQVLRGGGQFENEPSRL